MTSAKKKENQPNRIQKLFQPVVTWWRAFLASGHRYNRRLWGFYRHYISLISDYWTIISNSNRARLWLRNLVFWPLMGLAALMLYTGRVPGPLAWDGGLWENSVAPQVVTPGSESAGPSRVGGNSGQPTVEQPLIPTPTPASRPESISAPEPTRSVDKSSAAGTVPEDPVSQALAALPPFDPDDAVRPVSGGVTRAQGWYRFPPDNGEWRFVAGIELSAEPDEPVFAAYPGVVTEVVKSTNNSWQVVVSHKDGWSSQYEGLAEVAVKLQEPIAAGVEVGRMSNGEGGPVSFVLRRNGEPVDPSFYVH